jgi:Flp pilus assembly protein TadG
MVLPLLAALVLMLISFGKALYYYIELTHVANEGARLAAVSQATWPIDPRTGKAYTSIADYLCSQLGGPKSELRSGSASVDRAEVDVTYGTADKNAGDPVTVGIKTNYHWIPYFGGGSMAINGSATMRIENPPAATGASYGAQEDCPTS